MKARWVWGILVFIWATGGALAAEQVRGRVGSKGWTVASWYGEENRGRLMANGKPFDPDRMTCASWDFPLGTRLRVMNSLGESVVVTVTDRGPARRLWRQGRRLDLSRAAFKRVAGLELGLIRVRWER